MIVIAMSFHCLESAAPCSCKTSPAYYVKQHSGEALCGHCLAQSKIKGGVEKGLHYCSIAQSQFKKGEWRRENKQE